MNPSVQAPANYFWRESAAYWFCQLAGWGLVMTGPVLTVVNDWDVIPKRSNLYGIFLLLACGIALTHFLRMLIQRFNWKALSTGKLLFRLFVFGVSIALIWCSIYRQVVPVIDIPWKSGLPINLWCIFLLTYKQSVELGFFIFHVIFMSAVVGGWLFLYFVAIDWKRRQSAEAETWRLKAALATAELAALHAQTNPHFLFNALNGLRGLISENPRSAQDAVTRLAKILRYTLQINKVALVSLEQELQIVDDYLDLEGLRFEERLQVSRDIDPSTLSLLIPPMTVQTLVENAIKFGVSRHPGVNNVRIVTRLSNDILEVEVANDGDLNAVSTSTAIGIKNTTDRLRGLLGASSNILLASPSPGRVSATIVTPGRPFLPA